MIDIVWVIWHYLFFLTSCILIGVHTSPLDRSFDKENGGAKGRKEGKSGRWEIHSEDVYAQYCGYNIKMEGYTHC